MPPETPQQPIEVVANDPRKTALVGLFALCLIALVAVGFAVAYAQTPDKEMSSAAVLFAAPKNQSTYVNDPAFDAVTLEGRAAIVVDLATNKILFSRNTDAQLPLASITKIPLALVVSEVLSPDDVVTIPYDTAPSGSLERLGKGEKWRAQEIIDFTLVASSNAGAEILAAAAQKAFEERYPLAPHTSATLWRMNSLAGELKLTQTYFLNVSGLDVSGTLSGGYGSARDVSALFAYALEKYPSVFAGTAKDGLLLISEDGTISTSAINTNESQHVIPGLIMGKTGFTDLAGGNLAVAFDVGPAHPVVAVVLGSSLKGRFSDIEALTKAAREAIMH